MDFRTCYGLLCAAVTTPVPSSFPPCTAPAPDAVLATAATAGAVLTAVVEVAAVGSVATAATAAASATSVDVSALLLAFLTAINTPIVGIISSNSSATTAAFPFLTG